MKSKGRIRGGDFMRRKREEVKREIRVKRVWRVRLGKVEKREMPLLFDGSLEVASSEFES